MKKPNPKTIPRPRPPNLRGTTNRTRLCGGPLVDTPTTYAMFTKWQKRGVSQGVIIDRLVEFAIEMGFDPVYESFTGPTQLDAYPRLKVTE